MFNGTEKVLFFSAKNVFLKFTHLNTLFREFVFISSDYRLFSDKNEQKKNPSFLRRSHAISLKYNKIKDKNLKLKKIKLTFLLYTNPYNIFVTNVFTFSNVLSVLVFLMLMACKFSGISTVKQFESTQRTINKI